MSNSSSNRDIARSIFVSALWYKDVALLVDNEVARDIHRRYLILPAKVNRCFAIELLLKCLYAIENQQSYRRGHDLTQLFRYLDVPLQNEVRHHYKAIMESPDVQAIMARRQALPKELQITTGFDDSLDAMSKVFEKARYLFDCDISFNAATDEMIVDALLDAVRTRRPGWFNQETRMPIVSIVGAAQSHA